MLRPTAVAVGLLSIGLAGCDDDVSRVAALVNSVQAHEVCITTERTETAYLNRCYRVNPTDAARVHPGDCIAVAIPYQPEAQVPPMTISQILTRPCVITPSSGDAPSSTAP